MKRPPLLFTLLTLTLLSLGTTATLADDKVEEGFEAIFDGKSLDGWDGNPKFWRVEDGAITGQTTKDNKTNGNTFIIWRKGTTANFVLRLQYRIFGGNSGIQYRSFEPKGQKWVIGGYQADFEAGNTYSGILYGERFRGILANRGLKTVIGSNHKPKVVGKVGDSAEIQSKILKEDWNDYEVTANGFHFVHKINGVTTAECTDEDKEMRRDSGVLALQLHAGPPMMVQFRNIRIQHLPANEEAEAKSDDADGDSGEDGDRGVSGANGAAAKKRVVFMAGRQSHGYGSHEHYAGCMLLARSLKQAMPNFEVEVYRNGWPKEANAFDGADAVVMYCDGGGRHPVNSNLEQIDALAKKGVGVGCVHYGVEVPKGPSGEKFLSWIGGYFETHWSVNPHWVAKFEKFPDHPVSRGVKPFEADDEWYYHMRFRPEMKGVTPILSALPPKATLNRRDGAHSGNPHVRAAVARGEAQHLCWVSENESGGRGFGFTGGHNHWNWGNDDFRKVALNAIVWIAKSEVPEGGVSDKPVTYEDLQENQDYQQPGNFNSDAVIQRFNLKASPRKKGARKQVKPIFSSPVVTKKTSGHRVKVEADITGAKEIYLVASDGGNGFACDWAAWINPTISGPAGTKKLTELKWKSAYAAYGSVQVNKNCSGQAMRVNGETVQGIGTHANSTICFQLPPGYTKFQAEGGLDNGGTDQGACGDAASVQFQVYKEKPTFISTRGGGGSSRDPEDALDGLDIADGVEAQLFASEPELLSLTNLDVDHRGRVWVCEVVNYRRHNGKRSEGDRILILEDTDGDGSADKSKVYYQGREIDSAMGICVLGNKVIVSASPNVWVFTDEDGDDKPDKRELLFSKTGQPQHDHSAHSFLFGPDGKLYWNFGNTGRAVHDKDGQPIVDLAGNKVVDNGKPYFGGMVFRCDLDGSNFEVLGHNFRNNYEVTVDSFGTLWQSDNDDDGNRGVRINYVMEYGNYGYRDEMTGAGWRSKRTNMEKEVPLQHWHLNDPGVVPNLLQTGAGSPTGITVYEGKLLPKVFQGQVIHCDAGPNVVRAYPALKSGAGYTADQVNILHGARDKWFRPADACVAPDGSLFVTDWYDPGVGGHNMQDLDRGRLFRVAPEGSKYVAPKFDFTSPAGAADALTNPNYAVRYMAWTSLQGMGDKAIAPLTKLWNSDDARIRARALWALGKMSGDATKYVNLAIADSNPDIRIVGIRLARQTDADVLAVVKKLVKDPSSQVRRDCLIALRANKSPEAAELFAHLAAQHDGKDRWYLEAIGISAEGQWDGHLAAYLKHAGDDWVNDAAARDIVWRSRATQTPTLLAKIVQNPKVAKEEHPRFMRAFDFHKGPAKDAALKSILLGL